ncbi:hypothetical protein ABTE42_21420, partial [Acinetobacter baumannii]
MTQQKLANQTAVKTKGIQYCSLKQKPAPVFSDNVDHNRMSLLLMLGNKWVNGTTLHYYFFDQATDGSQVQLT